MTGADGVDATFSATVRRHHGDWPAINEAGNGERRGHRETTEMERL